MLSQYDPSIAAINPNDLYGVYDQYREREPLHYGLPLVADRQGSWYLFRHDDITTLLRSDSVAHLRHTEGHLQRPSFLANDFDVEDVLDRWFVFLEPPDHRRLRAPVARMLKTKSSDELRARVCELAHGLIDRFEHAATTDLMQAYAYPLPILVLAEFMGFPSSDLNQLWAWAKCFMDLFDRQAVRARESALPAFTAYFAHIAKVMQRRQAPSESLLADLMLLVEQGEYSENELLATMSLVLEAGAETAPMLIGNAIWQLLHLPEVRERFQTDASITAGTIDEACRLESPVQFTGRFATHDIRLHDQTIREGDYLVFVYGAANRDPDKFEAPAEFRVDRRPNPHLGFGAGAHVCTGERMGRIIAESAVRVLFDRFPAMTPLHQQPAWRTHWCIRGQTSLEVTLSRA